MLLNRKRITARELAEKFEVSIRTVYRDIDAINLAGIPITSHQGSDGGFGIIDTYKIDRQLLTLNDMLAMLSALKGINTTLEDRELDSAIEKITSLVPKDKTEQLNLHLEQLVIDILPWGYTKKQREKLKEIHHSIISNRLLNFHYRNYKGEKNVRTVEPMTLLFKGYAWYLFAYCCLRQDYRIFRLSRMYFLDTLEKQFVRREKSVHEVMKPDIDTNYWTHLVLKFSPKARVRVEDYFDEEQIEIQQNGDLIVKVSFPEDEWVYSIILSYGEFVEVLQPQHIRKIIQEKAKKIINYYQT